jgi:hypothetical protein
MTFRADGRHDSELESTHDGYVARVPSDRTQNIQEVHTMIAHTIFAIAERSFLPGSKQGFGDD